MASPAFHVEVASSDGTAVLSLNGELDLAAVDEFTTAVHAAIADCRHIELDLGGLDFLDSSGLRAIVAIHNASRTRGFTYGLRPGPPQVQRLFGLTGVRELLVFI